jgi:hypothetical protein
MHHGESESRGYGGIYGIAASLHHLDSGARRQFVGADHDPVLRMHRLGGGGNERRPADRQRRHQQQNQ